MPWNSSAPLIDTGIWSVQATESSGGHIHKVVRSHFRRDSQC